MLDAQVQGEFSGHRGCRPGDFPAREGRLLFREERSEQLLLLGDVEEPRSALVPLDADRDRSALREHRDEYPRVVSHHEHLRDRGHEQQLYHQQQLPDIQRVP